MSNPNSQFLSMWVVYAHPLDCPDKFVARRWLATDPPSPTTDRKVADDLETLRQSLPIGLVCLPRQPEDDPVIVETWI